MAEELKGIPRDPVSTVVPTYFPESPPQSISGGVDVTGKKDKGSYVPTAADIGVFVPSKTWSDLLSRDANPSKTATSLPMVPQGALPNTATTRTETKISPDIPPVAAKSLLENIETASGLQQGAAVEGAAAAGRSAEAAGTEATLAANAGIDYKREASEQGKVTEALNDKIQKWRYDPNSHWNKMSVGQRILSMIGIAAGGWLEGYTGGKIKNMSLELYNQEVDRQLQADRQRYEGYIQQAGVSENKQRFLLDKFDASENQRRTALERKTQMEIRQATFKGQQGDALMKSNESKVALLKAITQKTSTTKSDVDQSAANARTILEANIGNARTALLAQAKLDEKSKTPLPPKVAAENVARRVRVKELLSNTKALLEFKGANRELNAKVMDALDGWFKTALNNTWDATRGKLGKLSGDKDAQYITSIIIKETYGAAKAADPGAIVTMTDFKYAQGIAPGLRDSPAAILEKAKHQIQGLFSTDYATLQTYRRDYQVLPVFDGYMQDYDRAVKLNLVPPDEARIKQAEEIKARAAEEIKARAEKNKRRING